MKPFFELRIYQINPGKTDEWVQFIEDTIFPFQAGKGMLITGSFVMDSTDEFSMVNNERLMTSTPKGSTYVWIRRFESTAQKKELYKAVYESEEWTSHIAPIVFKLIDRNSIIVHNLRSTPLSLMR
ncbi:MAG: NIPSNAP family containing protein [Proteobacteria bacterium]|nr:NIPSNAP family containing protein [Pseudomonadota bacterium]